MSVATPSTTIFDSPKHTHEALKNIGYLIEPEVSTVVYLAGVLSRPLLLEGPAGAGKTELAVSVAKAEGMPFVRLQCYEGISDKQAIGDYNRALQEMFVLLQSKSQTMSWAEIRQEIKSRAYFMPGPLLEALESEERVVLLIDELDKVDHAFEAMLLEILSVWEMSIPGMGTIKAKKPPFTVITSNKERCLGFPLLRRSFYLEVQHPDPNLEAKIVARTTPEISNKLHVFIAGFAEALRAYAMEKPPSISEMKDLAKALAALGRERIIPEDKFSILPLIAKTEKDRSRLLMKEGFESLIATATKNAERILAHQRHAQVLQ